MSAQVSFLFAQSPNQSVSFAGSASSLAKSPCFQDRLLRYTRWSAPEPIAPAPSAGLAPLQQVDRARCEAFVVGDGHRSIPYRRATTSGRVAVYPYESSGARGSLCTCYYLQSGWPDVRRGSYKYFPPVVDSSHIGPYLMLKCHLIAAARSNDDVDALTFLDEFRARDICTLRRMRRSRRRASLIRVLYHLEREQEPAEASAAIAPQASPAPALQDGGEPRGRQRQQRWDSAAWARARDRVMCTLARGRRGGTPVPDLYTPAEMQLLQRLGFDLSSGDDDDDRGTSAANGAANGASPASALSLLWLPESVLVHMCELLAVAFPGPCGVRMYGVPASEPDVGAV